MAQTNKILDVQNAIVSALEAITTVGSAYNFDINRVSFGLPDMDQVHGGRTEIFLASIGEEGIQRPSSTVRNRATYVIVGVKQTDLQFGDLGIDTMKLTADIRKAIETDVTLGGVVHNSFWESTEATYYHSGAKAMVTITFASDYSTIIGQP